MEGFAEKNKPIYLFYEFLGTALIVLTFNIGQSALGFILLLVSIWSWEVSCAHFNPAITLAQLVGEGTGGIGSKLVSLLAILVV